MSGTDPERDEPDRSAEDAADDLIFLSSDHLKPTNAGPPIVSATDSMPNLAALTSAAVAMPKFNTADLMPNLAALTSAAVAMPKFNASSLTASMARSIASDFLNVGLRYTAEDGLANVARRLALADIGELNKLVGAARAAAPRAGAADEVLQSVVTKAAYAVPPPIGSDGLLVDDAATVTRWIAALVARALAASGLSERNLKEDAVAAYFYLLVAAIVFALLLNLPVFSALGGMLGLAAHPPAKVAAMVGRRIYKRMNT